MESQRFIVFSCGYNCEKYVEQHVESIRNQTYKNFIHVIVDHNKKNGKWVKNAVENLDTHIKSDRDVIVQVDLDDELFHSNVLKDLNEYYSNKDIWCTFSKWTMDKKKSIIHGGPTDYNVIKNRKFRGERWGPIGLSPLQTFKSFLWKNINKEDFKDERNNYFEESQDHSIYYPIIEMTPIEKVLFIDDVQYLYNIEHSCEWNKRSFMQELCHTKIDKLPPYDILKEQDLEYNYEEYLEVQKTNKVITHQGYEHSIARSERNFFNTVFKDFDKNSKIIDISCGEGIGLGILKELGFNNICGFDLNPERVKLIKERIGCEVFEGDMHDLSMFNDGEFDIIYSCHTIEHSYYPDKLLKEFNRILKLNSPLCVILPYPDYRTGEKRDKGHPGRRIIGTDKKDDAKSLLEYFSNFGFICKYKKYGTLRDEAEVYLKFIKEK